MKVFFSAVGTLIAVLALTWIFTGNDFFLYKFFAPKQEAVRREVFEQSKAYRQGMAQDLANMYTEYSKADDKHKEAIKDVVRHRFADLDESALPPYLRNFLNDMRK